MRAVALIVSLVVGVVVTSLAADAQQAGTVYRIGWLGFGSPASVLPLAEPFRQRLRELGYVEGKNLALEYRWAEGRAERLRALAADLAGLKVDLLVCATQAQVLACKEATPTIPIVTIAASDPVSAGLVASLARPGGNVTGLTGEDPQLSQKLVELLREAAPQVSRMAVFWDPTFPGQPARLREAQVAARVLGVALQPLPLRGPDDFNGAFATVTREALGALIVLRHPLFYRHQRAIIDFANTHRLPAMYFSREFVDGGGLMSYGPSLPALFRRAAEYADRILKGTKPGDLPMEQPTKFELVINLKTAKALGLTIPQSVLVRADEVIK